jgi:hypothetical protein
LIVHPLGAVSQKRLLLGGFNHLFKNGGHGKRLVELYHIFKLVLLFGNTFMFSEEIN